MMRINLQNLIAATLLLTATGTVSAQESEEEINIEDVSLEALLGLELDAGGMGSFGRVLQGDDDARVFIHGFSVNELRDFREFETEFFNLIVGGRISDDVLTEVQVEGAENGKEISLKYAQVDVQLLEDKVIARFGKFLAPVGSFNEYLYPEYLNKMVFPPLSHLTILPRGFTREGAQVRGQVPMGEHPLNYAVYIANNAVDAMEAAPEPGEEEEEELSSFISTATEEGRHRKAVGGRIGMHMFKNMEVGVSGYLGSFQEQAKSPLTIIDVDASWHDEHLTLRSEFIYARKSHDGESEDRTGAFFQAAYRIGDNKIEPAAQVDFTRGFEEDASNRTTFTGGLNLYPYPQEAPLLVVKIHEAYSLSDAEDESTTQVQVGLGF